MPWASTAISVGGSLLGGALGGGSKAAERAAKDAAARAANAQDTAARNAADALLPYTETGSNATRKLSELLGTADPVGYAAKPTRRQFEDAVRDEHFRSFGKDYNRNSNMGVVNARIDREYNEALSQWEAGKADFIAKNPNSQGSGELLKAFTNEDFVQDPGYTFRLMEGEKGINRNLLARGGFDSGAALKELNRYTQDYASNEFGNAYNRDAANKARTFGFLSDASGQGLSAVGAQVGSNQNSANQNTQIQTNLGNTLTSLSVNDADNRSNLLNQTISNLVYGYERNKNPKPDTDQLLNSGYTGIFNVNGTDYRKYRV